MKNILACIILLVALPVTHPGAFSSSPIEVSPSGNLFIITIDGFRWQEIFNGADEDLIGNEQFTPDTATMKMLYWDESVEKRRHKLMPFFWSVIAKKGQLYGNRKFDNKVNVSNVYSFSYPGYNEIFTGHTDIRVSSNKRIDNANVNVLEYLDGKEDFKGKVAAFTSWDVFPYILNEKRCGMMINAGYEDMQGEVSPAQQMINAVQQKAINYKGETRYDQLTFLTAREYLLQNRPRVLYIGLGETDEHAHHGRYDLYLEQANKIDRMIAELWLWIQTTPGYKDNTSLLITTDHGRGSRDSKWTSHSAFIKGSSQTWIAMMGPGIKSLGEVKGKQQLYQEELAALVARLVGEDFGNVKR